jgi:predicted FMN-binding regulatory protein PaiB
MTKEDGRTPSLLLRWLSRIRAGELVTVGSDGLEASFIPLLISDDATTVTGHLAKGNGVPSENSIFVSRSAFVLVNQPTETVVSTDQT